MTSLKAMDETNHVYTATVADGQLVLSVPIATIDNHDDFTTWAMDNADRINEVCRVAINSDLITAKEQAAVMPVQP